MYRPWNLKTMKDMMLYLGNSNFSETYFEYMRMPSHLLRDRIKFLEKYYKEHPMQCPFLKK
jgi:hypothetical protein